MIELLIAIFFAIYVVYHIFLNTPPNFPPGKNMIFFRFYEINIVIFKFNFDFNRVKILNI